MMKNLLSCEFSYQNDEISKNEDLMPLALTAVKKLEKLTSVNKKISKKQ